MSRATATPASSLRRAATVVLVRDGDRGMEVLLLRRVARSDDRSSEAFVFPGGTLDAGDAQCHACCAGMDDVAASARLSLDHGGLDYYVAAIRECFEEAGVLLATDAEVDASAWPELRARLRRGDIGMAQLCRTLGVRLAAERLAYHSHWLTPAGLPKRFDTRFFVAEMPAGQTASSDSEETAEHRWIRPSDALDPTSDLRLPTPTRRTLAAMAGFATAAECVAHARSLRDIRRILPVIADGPRGLQPVPPDEPAYAEVLRIDPHGTGAARYAIDAGRCVVLSPRVRRVTAPNPGLMTGPGTNTYLVGDASADAWAVIDPGPADEGHVEAIVAAAPGPIRWILATHTHRDHSPGAALLKARTGAMLLGMAALHEEGQDTAFVPDQALRHGDPVVLGPQTTLRVVHTPGHAANHLCYLLQEEKTLFTGDHVMQGSTVVINPPDGDMGDYMESLRRLLDEDLEWLAPGHGFLIADPRSAVTRLIDHRLAREAKVLRAIEEGCEGIDQLLARVYDDVHPALHAAARRSLLAHLLKLQAEGRARVGE
ncbi:MBL fold metallo-hydrolase [Piscinibacter sp. XHJ-5]|uniref:MBL fold metallo-hydrolase n=1 Tax=Piscinibacter sp. XHJ-5 TaxID=3037797 RepID=UPI002453534A|nr:MBL fold metallo-hydrolase [Piscinibacter sp. XHJ-5]